MITCNELVYIFASSRSWDLENLADLRASSYANWISVTSPAELNVALKDISPRFIFFVHWNWRVPNHIINQYECVCFHMTDLPYGRGGSPLQNLILNKQQYTKISAFRMSQEMDAGPIYLKRDLLLNGSAQSIFEEASKICITLIREIIDKKPEPIPQSGKVVLFKRRQPRDSIIDNISNIPDLYDFIRMLDAEDYPHAFLRLNGLIFEFTGASMDNDTITASVKIKKDI